jgi:pyridoxine 5'-phosphate synthase PdxJ
MSYKGKLVNNRAEIECKCGSCCYHKRKKTNNGSSVAAYCRDGWAGHVVHLREDRRHIQERDVRILRQTVKTKLNW